MMTDAELLDLSGRIEALRDEVTAAPAMYSFDDPLGPLAESDYAALNAAKSVIDRLYRWRHWNAPAGRCYLPSPVPDAEPQSQPTVSSMTDAELYAAWRGDRITNAVFSAECASRDWPQSFGGQFVMPTVQS